MRTATKAVLLLPALLLMFALELLSLPWLLVGMGLYMLGDADGWDRCVNASPIYRYMDWQDARRVKLG